MYILLVVILLFLITIACNRYTKYGSRQKKKSLNKQDLDKLIEDVDKNLTDVNGLVNTIVLNTKISDVENKAPSISDLVKKTNCNGKISETEAN